MPPAVIGIVGLPGSGKTEVAKSLATSGATIVRMGDVVWQELERRGRAITDANVGQLSNEFRKLEGMGAIAKRSVPLVEAAGKGKRAVVVDGIRGISEVDEFRKAFGKGFHLIAVWSSEKSRYSRIASRRRVDDPLNLENFREKDLRELSWGLGDALALADVLFVNEGSIAELRAKSAGYFKRGIGEKT